jgi:small-conductance mechanosensitive channel
MQDKYADALFIIVFLLALVNLPLKNMLTEFWSFVGAIVNPLLIIVLPGTFYYHVLKEEEQNGFWRYALAVVYIVLGLVLLLAFLTLATKNLFDLNTNLNYPHATNELIEL